MNVTKAKFLLFLDLDSKMAFDFIVCFPRCDYWSIIDICLHNRIHNIFINLFVMSRGNHMLKCLNRMKHYCKKTCPFDTGVSSETHECISKMDNHNSSEGHNSLTLALNRNVNIPQRIVHLVQQENRNV